MNKKMEVNAKRNCLTYHTPSGKIDLTASLLILPYILNIRDTEEITFAISSTDNVKSEKQTVI